MKLRMTILLGLMLIGCGSPSVQSEPGNPAEFTVTALPTDGQGQMYKIVGHGKTCYEHDNYYSGALLWCEDTK